MISQWIFYPFYANARFLYLNKAYIKTSTLSI